VNIVRGGSRSGSEDFEANQILEDDSGFGTPVHLHGMVG
jgi:hypothetical protein